MYKGNMLVRIIVFIIITITTQHSLLAQKTGAWRDHFAYTQGIDALALPKHLLSATTDGLIFIDGEITTISKVNGLSDVSLSAVLYNAEATQIIVGYQNGTIDILQSAKPEKIASQNNTHSITAWKNSSKYGNKPIHKFVKAGRKIYAATASCVLELDGNEISSDFSLDEHGDTLAVLDITLYQNHLVAATRKGLYMVHKDNPQLYYYKTWERQLVNTHIISLAIYKDKLYALQANGTLLVSDNLQNFTQQAYYNQPLALSVAADELWLSSSTALHNVFNPSKTLKQYAGQTQFAPLRIVSRGAQLLIADQQLGGVFISANGNFNSLLPNGNLAHSITSITQSEGKILATSANTLSVLPQQGKWVNIANNLKSANTALANPSKPNQTHVSTSSGIVQFANQSLEAIDLASENIQAMAFDNAGKLFAFASYSNTPVNIRTANGSWERLAIDNLQRHHLKHCTFNETLFMGIANNNRLYAYNPSDKTASVFGIQLNSGESFSSAHILSIAADRNGEVWLGTSQGVLSYPYLSSNLSEVPKAVRVRVPTEIEGYASYLLMYEQVTAIAIDGGNRKWFGTRSAGVFLQSDDGTEQLQAFNANNSALPSNNIFSIAVNGATGEVLFATDKGIVGYYSDAIEGRTNFDEAKVYPNPARPNMYEVTITNLMENASVRITDVSGNLVFFGTANGGTITWDLQSLTGRRVATGVYLIFLADEAAKKGKVLKLLVVN
ncbi:MAG: two-component regulator propeller domain-containing protein [Bacteroidales bacterium]